MECTDCDWLPTIRKGHNYCTKAQSERQERAQRRKEEQIVKAQVTLRTAEAISDEPLDLTVQE